MLTAIQSRINEKVPEISYVDQDMGQMDNENTGTLLYPCLLIDFTGTTFNQYSQLTETGDATIQIRIGYNMSSNGTTQNITEAALACYNLEGKVYTALKGWQPDNGICQPLNRVSDAPEIRTDGIRVRKLLFNTQFEDNTAVVNYATAQPHFVLE